MEIKYVSAIKRLDQKLFEVKHILPVLIVIRANNRNIRKIA